MAKDTNSWRRLTWEWAAAVANPQKGWSRPMTRVYAPLKLQKPTYCDMKEMPTGGRLRPVTNANYVRRKATSCIVS